MWCIYEEKHPGRFSRAPPCRKGPTGCKFRFLDPNTWQRLKIFAIKNNPLRVLQDLEDIRRILRFPGVDKDEIEGYFRRYGLEALLDRLE